MHHTGILFSSSTSKKCISQMEIYSVVVAGCFFNCFLFGLLLLHRSRCSDMWFFLLGCCGFRDMALKSCWFVWSLTITWVFNLGIWFGLMRIHCNLGFRGKLGINFGDNAFTEGQDWWSNLWIQPNKLTRGHVLSFNFYYKKCSKIELKNVNQYCMNNYKKIMYYM